MIRTNDHEPPHVHIIAPGAEAKVRIVDGHIYSSKGFNKRTLDRLVNEIERSKVKLEERWNEIHQEKE